MLTALPIFYLSILTIFLISLSWIISKQLKTIFLLESQFKYFTDKRQTETIGLEESFAFAKVCVAKQLFVNAIVESQNVLKNNREFNNADHNQTIANLYNMLGFIYYEAGYLVFSKDFYSKAIEIDSNYLVALNNLAKIYEDTKDFKQAEVLYKQVLKINCNNQIAIRRMKFIEKTKLS